MNSFNKNRAYSTEMSVEIDQPMFDVPVGWRFWKKRRYVVGALAFFGTFTLYILRVNLSIAIVAMTTGSITKKPEFEWDPKTRGLVLAGFFYGYASMQFFGGWLSSRIGGKRVVGVGIGVSALLTLLTPSFARQSVYLLIALRIAIGFFEGMVIPALNSIWANYAPPLERSKLTSLTMAGISTGVVFSMPASGLIAENLGWPAIFYIYGLVGIVWFTLWYKFVSDKPSDDPWISKSELDYLKRSLNNDSELNGHKKKISHPWKAILTSAPVWAIWGCHGCAMWGYHTMVTQLPLYFLHRFNFQIERTGFMSALPYVGEGIVLMVSGCLADYLRSHNYMTTTQVRKTITCSGFILQAIFMTLASFLNSSTAVVVCITLSISLGAFATSGYMVNYLDLAPRHASVLFGMGNTLAAIAGAVSPILTGYIVKNKTAAEWRIVLIIVACTALTGAILYGIFASGEKQKWADDVKERESSQRFLQSQNIDKRIEN